MNKDTADKQLHTKLETMYVVQSEVQPEVDVAVLILFFNRPEQLNQVFQQVRLARPSRLYLYQDGPRHEKDMPGIKACREVVRCIDWQCEVHCLYQEQNYGCDPSEFMAQKWAFSHEEKCVVLEDDDVPSVSFFRFCKEMLDRYEHDERIGMIAGFNAEEITPDVQEDYFFTRTFSIWGWASWRRVVDLWDEHYTFLDDAQAVERLHGLIDTNRLRSDFFTMCQSHRSQNKAFYETIFQAALFLNSYLCIMPKKNMINNLGATAGSVHFGASTELLPRGYRRIFTMKRYEMEMPVRSPKYIIEHTEYKKRIYRIMGWRNPMIKIGRSFEELYLNLRHGNFSNIGNALKNRISKWLKIYQHR